MAAIFLGRSDCAPENEMVAFEIARIPNEENNERKICGRFRKCLSFIWMVHGLAKLISFFFFFFHHSSFFLRALTLHSPTWVCALQIKKHANHNLLLAGWLEYIHHLIYSYYFALFFALCTSKTQICVVYTHTLKLFCCSACVRISYGLNINYYGSRREHRPCQREGVLMEIFSFTPWLFSSTLFPFIFYCTSAIVCGFHHMDAI